MLRLLMEESIAQVLPCSDFVPIRMPSTDGATRLLTFLPAARQTCPDVAQANRREVAAILRVARRKDSISHRTVSVAMIGEAAMQEAKVE